MKDDSIFQAELNDVLNTGCPEELLGFMERNIAAFFSTPDISTYYHLLKGIDISVSKKLIPKLIFAWLAFLSGDNANLFSVIKYINENELQGPHQSSFYYSLKAMMGFMMNNDEGIRYAKLSLDVLPKEDESFYMENARLTYGQLLSGSNSFRLASEMFASSYKIFYSRELHFPAVVALTNEALNRYKLGEFTAVLDKCNEALLMSGSFTKELQDYWYVLNLPLGMCYYEMNKPNLAIRHLKLAKSSIDKMKLFHMHGYIELYLYKSYYMLNDLQGMESIMDEAVVNFEHMQYRQTDFLISMFRILSAQKTGNCDIQQDIERLEVEYLKNGENSHIIVFETLAYLKIKGLSESISIENIVKRLEKLRFTGMIPLTQLFLLILAEMHYMENRHKDAVECLREAVGIYREYGISAAFYACTFKAVELIGKIDQHFYNMLCRNRQEGEAAKPGYVLSAREKEIMQLIALGKTNEEMSKTLFIGIGTIKWHINNIFGKLEVKNRVQAIEKARSLGEIS